MKMVILHQLTTTEPISSLKNITLLHFCKIKKIKRGNPKAEYKQEKNLFVILVTLSHSRGEKELNHFSIVFRLYTLK